jgi:hypothetical protein
MSVKKRFILNSIIILVLFLSTVTIQGMVTSKNNYQNNSNIIDEHLLINRPELFITPSNETSISISSVDTYLSNPGMPKIPIIKKTYIFPKNTIIQHISCNPSKRENIILNQPLEKIPQFYSITGNKVITNNDTNLINLDCYPNERFTTQTGAGISSSGEHMVYLTITLYPIQYHLSKNMITYSSDFDIKIEYNTLKNKENNSFEENHELVIITPEQYVQTLNSFVNHKENLNLNPLVKTTDDITNQFQGRDEQEKIKYFIKHAIESYNTQYVLLIGDITQLPIRKTDAYPWGSYHGSGILTDLYYSDIYDESYSFSSWDTNNNNVFGEVTFDSFPPSPENIIDEVDLYPDVHIGRIPCSTIDELTVVLSKIITYEEITSYQNWFKRIILAGGDTFPLSKGSPLNVFEGEITNVKVGQQLSGFEQTRLWTSERNLNARTFNQAISNGAGFVSYAGHGFEHGWGTYRPNAIIDSNLIAYFTPFIKRINNEHRLPIIFFDACLTTKLDFNISDLTAYYGLKGYLISHLLGFDNSDTYYPSFAWAMIKKDNGGAIATVGATRPAYTYVDKDGVYAGAGFLDVRFFHAYDEGITVGEMLTQAQTDYQNYVGKDMFTIEEYILLGDPSLRVGGYF